MSYTLSSPYTILLCRIALKTRGVQKYSGVGFIRKELELMIACLKCLNGNRNAGIDSARIVNLIR